ncbi:hypothetical protein KMZ93_19765 [Bradyrhizobium sediminis]|uniref:Uncharacterized protein n=1 Tax=Bradyrhizobium sediminis TaxID=2840469 RepID=A0A975RWK0_9BRAD|nr:hypothetical protein [Bradyrhizobium sediminis]QWG22198.1 hypothetical protein KMZ93_19765 [Bradyrhizobium sediminis]
MSRIGPAGAYDDVTIVANKVDAVAAVAGSKRPSEHEVAMQVRDVLAAHLSGEYQVHQGKNILYWIEVNTSGKISHDGLDAPRRGQYAFQTDILITKGETPLVVVELKSGSFSTHDVITYSWKAERHKQVYPYLRYGFAVVGVDILGRRFVTHNEGFDFAVALPDTAGIETDLVAIVRRQIASAERIIDLIRSSRIRLRRYEQNIEIDR